MEKRLSSWNSWASDAYKCIGVLVLHMGPCHYSGEILYFMRCDNRQHHRTEFPKKAKNIHHFWFRNLMWVHVSRTWTFFSLSLLSRVVVHTHIHTHERVRSISPPSIESASDVRLLWNKPKKHQPNDALPFCRTQIIIRFYRVEIRIDFSSTC